jgi:predicted nuclease with TOPRIM domain
MDVMSKENVESWKAEVVRLKKKVRELEQDLEMSKNLPIAKKEIYKLLTARSGTNVSDQVLVDIEFNEDKDNGNQLTIVGRPPVIGSSGKQMRHVC